MFTRTLTAALALFAGTTRAADEPKSPTPDEVKAAKEKVAGYLKSIEGAESATVRELVADGEGAAFPDHVLFSVLFRQYPVARVAPPPLGSSNVVAVPKKKDGKPVPLTDLNSLEKFFKESARPVEGPDEVENAVKAWLRAAAELNQDGFYKFTVKFDVGSGNGKAATASGAAVVDPQGGNKGEIKATLKFQNGKLAAAETKVNLSPGPRPICQATKLLDPDPIVRRMAEDAIRVMGTAAKPYLDEQREKASPELKAAIDRMWAQIQKEGR